MGETNPVAVPDVVAAGTHRWVPEDQFRVGHVTVTLNGVGTTVETVSADLVPAGTIRRDEGLGVKVWRRKYWKRSGAGGSDGRAVLLTSCGKG